MQVLVTQRVDSIESYNETRDSLDQRWIDFLLDIDITPIIVPNNVRYVEQFLKTVRFDGVLLTGGNSLVQYGGLSPERDSVEGLILAFAIEAKLPVLGVCRGMQVIQNHFGVNLKKVQNHVASKHEIIRQSHSSGRLSPLLLNMDKVNSYHDYGAFELPEELISLAESPDGIIESMEHRDLPLYGIMWHPEREEQINSDDQKIIRFVFGS